MSRLHYVGSTSYVCERYLHVSRVGTHGTQRNKAYARDAAGVTDLGQLTPVAWQHSNLYGRYAFTRTRHRSTPIRWRQHWHTEPHDWLSDAVYFTFLRDMHKPVTCKKFVPGVARLCSPVAIVMHHPAQDVSPLDWACRRPSFQWNRTPLLNALMRP